MKKILVTGSGGSASIGFTRCLKMSPEKIFMVGTDCNERFIFNSETEKKILIPSVKSPEYIDIINEIAGKNQIEFLHAQPDAELEKIAENSDKISCRTFLPSRKTIEICQNKLESQKIWDKKNVPTAKTIFIESPEDLKKAFESIGTPLWLRAIKGAGGKGSLLVQKYGHGEQWIDYWKGWGNFVASEYLPGANIGCDAIFKDGELVASQVKERLEYVLPRASPSGVTGTSGVIKAAERKDIDEICKNAVYSIDPNPNGIFSIDLKEDKNKNPCVTEINPGRFLSSSLHFFYMAKNLLPYIYLKLAYKETVPQDLIKSIKPGTILVRSLDSQPMLLDENMLKQIADRREKEGYVALD